MISKRLRQIMAASMAVVMTVGLTACGSKQGGDATPTTPANEPTKAPVNNEGNNGTNDNEGTPEEPTSPYEILKDADGNVYDLGGMEVIIRDWWSPAEPAEPSNAFEEARDEYYDWMQETYHFTVKREAIGDWGSNPQDFTDYVTNGGDDKNYLFILRQDGTVVTAMNNDLMYDLATLDCLDFSEAKWQKTKVHELFSKNGGKEIYAMASGDVEPRDCMFFNKRLVEEAGIMPADLYKWQADGTWTFEKWEECLSKVQRDIDNDGIIDVYGFVANMGEAYSDFVFSNNGSFVDRDANGMLYNDLESPETIYALTYAVGLRDKYHKPQPEGAEWDWYKASFYNAEAAFLPDCAYFAGDLMKNMTDEYGCIVFPKGPSADEYVSWTADNVFAIPSCYDADRAWKIAFVYDLYTADIPGFEENDNWKASYYNNFYDIESVDETLELVMKGARVKFESVVAGIELGSDLLWNLGYTALDDGSIETPAQAAERIRELWNSDIAEANK